MSEPATRAEGVKSEFSKRWIWQKHAPNRAFYNWVLRLAYRVLIKHTIVHPENLPASGPVILMINHLSGFDPLVVLAAFERLVVPMAKVETFENPKLGWLVHPYGAIPVHRGAVDIQAIKAATEVLKSGGMILISPEGTRSKTGGLIQAQEGFAFLAARTNAQIVPVAIVGTKAIGPSLKKLRRAPITITLGAPFMLQTGGKKPDREMLQQLTDEAMFKLAALLPPELRGVYSR
jgi:1-acyl-sn-glycerol-3-phosphate acyltransferase